MLDSSCRVSPPSIANIDLSDITGASDDINKQPAWSDEIKTLFALCPAPPLSCGSYPPAHFSSGLFPTTTFHSKLSQSNQGKGYERLSWRKSSKFLWSSKSEHFKVKTIWTFLTKNGGEEISVRQFRNWVRLQGRKMYRRQWQRNWWVLKSYWWVWESFLPFSSII